MYIGTPYYNGPNARPIRNSNINFNRIEKCNDNINYNNTFFKNKIILFLIFIMLSVVLYKKL